MPASRYKVPPPALRLLERYRASRLSCRQLHIRKQVKETTGSHDQAAGGEKSKGGRGSKQDVQWVDLQVKVAFAYGVTAIMHRQQVHCIRLLECVSWDLQHCLASVVRARELGMLLFMLLAHCTTPLLI